MFTGLIEQLGRVMQVLPQPEGIALAIDPCGWSYAPAPGASIAVNGCCLTAVIKKDAESSRLIHFDVVHQTLRATTLGELQPGQLVHLEHAATPATLLGGHIVQGHIDGVAIVRAVSRDQGASRGGECRITFEPPAALMDYIIEKGSVAVNGVSLTVAEVEDEAFTIALIPATLERTALGELEPGARCNLETDYFARTVIHWLRRQPAILRQD